jgi:type II secretion system protein N
MHKKPSYSLKARILFVLYAVVCLFFFSCMRFPYHIVKPKVEGVLSRAMHTDVSVGNITGHFPFGLAFEDLRIGGETVAPRLMLRPAFTGLLMGRLAVVMALEQAQGRLDCTVKTSFKNPGDPLALKFKLKDFDLAPLKKIIPGAQEIAGTVTGEGRLTTERASFRDSQGTIDITCKNGQIPLHIPSLPLAAVTFSDLTFKAEMDRGQLDIEEAKVNGNDISGALSGGVRLGMRAEASELNITGTVKLSQAYRMMLGNSRSENMRFRIQGTLQRPRFLMP